MKRQRFKFKLLAFFLFALFALLGAYGIHSIALYGNRWFTYAKNPRVRAQKQNVVPGDILDRSGVVLATSSVSEDGTVTRVWEDPLMGNCIEITPPAAPLCTCWAIPTGRLPTGLKVFKLRTSTASRPGFGSGFRRL